MIVRSMAVAIGLLLATGVPAAAQQQSRKIEVPSDKKWQHAATGLIVPTALAGLPRNEITDASDREIDVSLQFGDSNTTHATIFLFRPALMDVPVWFDRVETQVLKGDTFGAATPIGTPSGFALPGGTATSALRRVYQPAHPPFRATGVAVLPLGQWLVVVRLSSAVLSPAELDTKLSTVVAELGWPARKPNVPEAPAAAPVQPCATPLRYDPKAKMKKPDMAAGLLGATLAMMASKPPEDGKKEEESAPATFCRDGEGSRELGVYRALPADSFAYTIAIADAGNTISVYPDLLSDAKKPGYAVTLNTLERAYVFPAFDRLPEPVKVMDALTKTRPISSTGRDGNEISIQAQ